jgi:2-polyprenyl-3-methyl-5-hydroxy-6-metoxy-1,4-benzoquinol methylase
MESKLDYIVSQICSQNPLHGKKIKKNIKNSDDIYFKKANKFLTSYNDLLEANNKTLDYAIDCYLQMIADVYYESVQFLQTGKYTSSSFEEVNKRVYGNPEVMEYYMHGLLLSQFLWSHHYDILLYFNKIIDENKSNINNYLEVGGGHGLYISEATKVMTNNTNYDLVDISPSSLDIAQKLINNDIINYILTDVYEYFPNKKYDFITLGEVLEHVEDPIKLLKKLHLLLQPGGKVFITTPTNAPAIDHIYLFKNAEDIREIIDKASFKIEQEKCIYSEDLPEDLLEKYKISMMYIGVLSKK